LWRAHGAQWRPDDSNVTFPRLAEFPAGRGAFAAKIRGVYGGVAVKVSATQRRQRGA